MQNEIQKRAMSTGNTYPGSPFFGQCGCLAAGASLACHDADRQDLVEYLAYFDLTLADLQPEQTAMFLAARNLAPLVAKLEIPLATQCSADQRVMRQRQTNRRLQQTLYVSDLEARDLPTDFMDVAPIRGTEDLPRIFPVQWMLEELCPDAFYAKVAQRELLMPLWQAPFGSPRDSDHDEAERELEEDGGAATSTLQHAYVLLDTSRTMNDRDRRATVARGLALALFHYGHQQRVQLNFRPFTAEVGPLTSGREKETLRAIVERIVTVPNAGQTWIQDALECAVADIRGEGPCRRADIMLITDGISRLTRRPMISERLHTFLLGDLREGEETAGAVSLLKAWSDSFHRVWKHRFAVVLAPRRDDLRAVEAVLRQAMQCGDRSCDAATRLRRVLANAQALALEFKRRLDEVDAPPEDLLLLEQSVAEAGARLQTLDAAESELELPSSSVSLTFKLSCACYAQSRVLGLDLWSLVCQLVRQGIAWKKKRMGQVSVRPCPFREKFFMTTQESTRSFGPQAGSHPRNDRPSPTGPASWPIHKLALLGLQLLFGLALFCLGDEVREWGPLPPVVLGTSAVIGNVLAVGAMASWRSHSLTRCVAIATAVFLASTAACVGIALAWRGPAWYALTLLGVLENLEIVGLLL
jgi:hypothetical protein